MNATWVNASSTTAVCSAPTPTPTPTPTPAPTAVPGTQWCGLKTIYFDNTATLPVGYESLNATLPEKVQVIENVTVINTGGEVLIDSYISPQGLPGITYIESGTEIHHMYAYVSNAGGVTRFNITMFTRDITGVETLRYQGYSADIDNLAVAEVKTNIAHARLYMADTDRIVVKIYAVTDSAAAKQLYWIYQGSSHASYIESAYFNCAAPTTTTAIPTWQPEINPPTDYKADPWVMVKDWWWIAALVASLMIIFGGRR
jgi:hypothetical protein